MRTTVPKRASDGAQNCSVLGTLAVVGDFWALGIVRCAVYGLRRFGEFERELGIATNVLADRLDRLVGAGVLRRVEYQSNPARYEYILSHAGQELAPVILALKLWGDRYVQPRGPWTSVRHRGCTSSVDVRLVCPDCGAHPSHEETELSFLR